MKQESLFDVSDPRGYTVSCSKDQWENHIILGHPEVSGKESLVQSAISDPDIIFKSDEYNDRDVYFRKIDAVDNQMKVIVKMTSNFGDVITAFPRKGVKGGIDTEVVRYVKP